MSKTRKPLHKGDALAAVGFLTPSFVGLVVFSILPIIAALVISLLDWDILTPPKYIGFANYAMLWHELTTGQTLRQVMANTIYFTAATVPLSMAVSLLIAMLPEPQDLGPGDIQGYLFYSQRNQYCGALNSVATNV